MKFYPFIILSILGLASVANAQHIVINEIMYAPVKPEPEWIEVFNPADTPVIITGWTIANHSHSYSLSADTIASNGYVILTKDSAHYLRIKYSIPNANILVNPMPSLGNTGDDIVLKDSLGEIIDSVKYSPNWGGIGGTNSISLERIDYLAPSDSSNFGSCIDSLGATPVKENSIRRRDYDLAIESFSYSASNQTDLSFTITIFNKGRKEISVGTLTLNTNSGLPLVTSQIVVPIPPLGKQDITVSWQNADFGRSQITAIINEPKDEVRSNDSIYTSCYLPIARDAIVINEIMATPPSGASQWIELYNNSSNCANMDSTALRVKLDSKFYTFLIDSFRLCPKQYAVICADSNFFQTFSNLQGQSGIRILNKSQGFHLKDTGNDVMFVNIDSTIIDSLHFYSSWYLPVTKTIGISLERKNFNALSTDPSNWSASSDPRGATPLEKNSNVVDSAAVPKMVDVQISPNPFSPDGDGFDDATNITIWIPSENQELISAKLYDLRGRLHKTFLNNQGIDRVKILSFDGKDDNGLTLPIGLYTLVVESSSGLFSPQRKGIVIIKKPK